MLGIELGDSLGTSYRFVKRLGEGAVGEVWLIESTVNDEKLAAKILKSEHADNPEIVERFVRERSVLVGLKHANIVSIRDLVVEGSVIAIVMDYIAGGTLRDSLKKYGTITPAQALGFMAQVFDGLAEAHAKGVIHRDIKPDNILLDEVWGPNQKATVQVADFGISSIMELPVHTTQGLLGTPDYMAPELISQGQVTTAGDIYSAGITLYELLAGRTPFGGEGNDFTVAYRHVNAQPARLHVPEPLADWVEQLLAKDPLQRPSAAEAAIDAKALAAQIAELDVWNPHHAQTELVEQPATSITGKFSNGDAVNAYVPPMIGATPNLGEADQSTVVRSQAPESVEEVKQTKSAEQVQPGWWQNANKKILLLVVAAIVLGVVLVLGISLLVDGVRNGFNAVIEPLEVTQQDLPLPTGLGVTRTATYDPAEQQITLDFTYSAQKSPLAGSFLEIVPSLDQEETCPTPIWEDVQSSKHKASSGLSATCGWELKGISIPENGQFTFSATFDATISDQAELTEWLDRTGTETAQTLADSEANSTAYPVQRLQDLQISVPSRTVSQTTLPITVIPVWPKGPDELNPLYQSPSAAAPSQLLTSVAGDHSGIRFSDSCSGAVAVSTDGLTATTLSPTPECHIHASVGNFTNLKSEPFSVTTRD